MIRHTGNRTLHRGIRGSKLQYETRLTALTRPFSENDGGQVPNDRKTTLIV